MKTALVVCRALAREVLALKEKHAWNVDVLGVPLEIRKTGYGKLEARLKEQAAEIIEEAGLLPRRAPQRQK